MPYLLKNAQVFADHVFKVKDLSVMDGCMDDASSLAESIAIDCSDYFIFPGFVDVHVHLREPGFSYKETIASGSLAAAHGGFTTVCTMPNLNPVPDCTEHLAEQLKLISETANVRVMPYGAISRNQTGRELADMAKLAPYIVAFSDDGHGVQNDELMRQAMRQAKALGKLIVAHCEDNSLLRSGYIHDGAYARAHAHRGICSESEWRQVKRDLQLVRETGCAYHVCHVSTKESVALLRRAKAEGLNVSCETAPHYLLMCEDDLQEDGRFKMNPPLRGADDRAALIEGLLDGTIDMIATDHAPHSTAEKARGLRDSAFGIVGLETAFPLLYTHLVQKDIISLPRLIELMSLNPARRFGLERPPNSDLTVFDLADKYTINPANFLSQGRATPFAGWEVCGKCKLTMVNGRIVWQENTIEN